MNEIEVYINKQPSPQKEMLFKLNKMIVDNFKGINVQMYGGVPCYGKDGKHDFGLFYLVGLKDHVNLGVSIKGLSEENLKKLDKVGKVTGHIEFKEINKIDVNKLVSLLTEVR